MATSGDRAGLTGTTTTTTFALALPPTAAYEAVLQSLGDALGRRGITFDLKSGAPVLDGARAVGCVTASEPGERIALELWPAGADKPVTIELIVAQRGDGTLVTYSQQGWHSLVEEPDDLAGWAGAELLAPLLSAVTPRRLGDWVTDRRARRPIGARARDAYGQPTFHLPNFGAILELLALDRQDRLLEVGCGGGVLLAGALAVGCSAAAVDHSPAMIALARERNAAAIAAGRLELHVADAARLPFPSGSFTCATMTGVLGFLPDPVAALAEIRRTLTPDGRLVVLGIDPAWRDTPAAPEPIASRLRFYEDDELAEIGRRAGFADAEVRRIGLGEHARAAGLPEEYVEMFTGPSPFLVSGVA
ncbi:MAG: methyltransferase domain-containing protein [Solirubrobacteraceae bacterium]